MPTSQKATSILSFLQLSLLIIFFQALGFCYNVNWDWTGGLVRLISAMHVPVLFTRCRWLISLLKRACTKPFLWWALKFNPRRWTLLHAGAIRLLFLETVRAPSFCSDQTNPA